MADDGALYLGLISGTSADGVDAALVAVDPRPRVLHALSLPYPPELRADLIALAHAGEAGVSLDRLGALDVSVARAFAHAARTLLLQCGVDARQVAAIGSHGQTVRHRPRQSVPFTLQLGDPSTLAELTGITTVADFRRRDIAAGGEGAPLMPAFHAAALGDRPRAVLNLGGIGNFTLLGNGPVRGFDTGPANCLLDHWASRHGEGSRDDGGRFAARGRVIPELLERLLDEPYFTRPAPKSTGREQFDPTWLADRLGAEALAPADVQATLVALTARTIADALAREAPEISEVVACGGGVHNPVLMNALEAAFAPVRLNTTADYGLDPDFVEAAGFAWLAHERLQGRPGNRPEVTGAAGPRILGGIYAA